MYEPIQFISGQSPDPDIKYREYPPSLPLSPHVACFWSLSTLRPLNGSVHRVLADGCADIICDIRNSRSFITGLSDRTEFMTLCGDVSFFGIRFLPMAIPFILGKYAPLRTNENTTLDATSGMLHEMSRRICDTQDTHRRIDIAQHGLEMVFRNYAIRPLFSSLLLHALDAGGMISVREMSDYHGLSEKQIGRVFSGNIGLTPKPFLRVIRFQNVYREFARRARSTASLALDAGYYDQSHLIKEMNYFLGTIRNIY